MSLCDITVGLFGRLADYETMLLLYRGKPVSTVSRFVLDHAIRAIHTYLQDSWATRSRKRVIPRQITQGPT